MNKNCLKIKIIGGFKPLTMDLKIVNDVKYIATEILIHVIWKEHNNNTIFLQPVNILKVLYFRFDLLELMRILFIMILVIIIQESIGIMGYQNLMLF
jgi:hypothetical protein